MSHQPLHLLKELQPLMDRPFVEKHAEACLIIQKQLSLHPGKLAVAWSGGKDSTLVLSLILSVTPQIPVIFNNTGVEYPETLSYIRDFALTHGLNLITTHPERNFWKCIQRKGFPSRKRSGGNICCYWLKEKPMRLTLQRLSLEGYFTGVTATENTTRMFNARDYGTCYQTKGFWKFHPILWWTSTEVLDYLKEKQIPINPLYSQGLDRVGCSTCTSFLDWESQLSIKNPKLYALIKLRKDAQHCMLPQLFSEQRNPEIKKELVNAV